VAVVGRTGRGDYGHALDEAWLEFASAQIVGVTDDDKVGLAAAKMRLGVERGFSNYEQMLDETKPDIVSICQRWLDQHRDMAVAAAGRGIHVYMEKPMCRSLAEADEIIDACQRAHVKLAVAHPTGYSPKVDRLKKLIEAGRLGKVLEYRGRGKEDGRGGGEDLWVLGSHVMDMICTIGGRPDWCFAQVLQDGEPVTARHVAEGNEGIGPLAGDALHAMYGMSDGTTAYFSSVRNTAGNPSRYGLQIFCSHGIVDLHEGTMPDLFCLRDRGWSPPRSGVEWMPMSSEGFDKPEPLDGSPYTDRHTLAIQDLIKSIEDPDRQPKCSMYRARDTIEMIAGIFESHRQGKPVALPLENRENPLTLLEG
jgi:predicted dehydrogenase